MDWYQNTVSEVYLFVVVKKWANSQTKTHKTVL